MGHSHASPAGRPVTPADERAMRRVTTAAVAVASSLVLLKIWAWSATNAVSLFSSLADSLFDVLVSACNFFAIRYALKPADEEHRFGHNSIEDIAGLAQCAFISGSMGFVAAQAVQRLINPEPIQSLQYGVYVMALSLAMTALLYVYQRQVYRRTGSLIVRADSLHYLGDLLMNMGIILSLLAMGWANLWWLDAVLAIVIAVYVIHEGWEIGVRAFNNLMDREMPEADKQALIDLLNGQPHILGYHDLRTRYSGMKCFIEMHIELDRQLSFQEAHDISDKLEDTIRQHYPAADVLLHQDPVTL